MDRPDHFNRHLKPDERVVWSQQAHPKAIRRGRIGALVFLSIGSTLLLGLIAYWSTQAWREISSGAGNGVLWIGCVLFAAVVLAVWLRFAWDAVITLRHGGETHYALTSSRFLVVDDLRMTDYKPALFARMQAPAADMLLFDWGEGRGRHRREHFRGSLLGLDDAPALEALIRRTFNLHG